MSVQTPVGRLALTFGWGPFAYPNFLILAYGMLVYAVNQIWET